MGSDFTVIDFSTEEAQGMGTLHRTIVDDWTPALMWYGLKQKGPSELLNAHATDLCNNWCNNAAALTHMHEGQHRAQPAVCRCPTSVSCRVNTLTDDAMMGQGHLANRAEQDTLNELTKKLNDMRTDLRDVYTASLPKDIAVDALVYTPVLTAKPNEPPQYPPLEVLMLNLITKNADSLAPHIVRTGFTVSTGLKMVFQTMGPICRVANVFASDRDTLVSSNGMKSVQELH